VIAVVGAGVSGLSCAWWLARAGHDVVVFEAATRVGGMVRTEVAADCRFEAGPNTLLAGADHLEWMRALGLEPLPASPLSRHRFILRNGAYRALPGGPLGLLCGDFFPWRTRWALMTEALRRPARPARAETVAGFFRRRLGQDFLDLAINPLIAGIYAGDPEALLIDECMPLLAAAERDSGSIIVGMLRRALGGALRRRAPYSLAGGLETLPRALARSLDVRLACGVHAIAPMDGGWRLDTDGGPVRARTLVLALPAPAAARLCDGLDPALADALAAIPYAPMNVVASRGDSADMRRPLRGFGGLHPRCEGAFAAGHLMSGAMFPDNVAPGRYLVSSYVGGQLYRREAALEDDAFFAALNREFVSLFACTRPPSLQTRVRVEQALPQADAAVPRVRTRLEPWRARALHVCANWLDGVSVPDCLDKGRALAGQIAAIDGGSAANLGQLR
jgi:oxygen-dependent protoporphyrinogen oxidase